MFVCNNCGRTIDDEELTFHSESHGERRADDCSCGGEFVAAKECLICGKAIDKHEDGDICSECLDEHKTFDNAVKIGKENEEQTYINGFFFEMLTKDEIETALTEFSRKKFDGDKDSVKKYIDADPWYFEDWLMNELEN
jgi:hypothetical protein